MMQARFNPYFDPAATFPKPDPAVLRFHRSLAGYDPTPLHSLGGLARELGVANIFLKDESQRFGLKAFKAMGAAWAVHRFLERANSQPVTFASATDGNHGRALAWAASRSNQQAVIYIPHHAVPARVQAIHGEGAEVRVVDGSFDDAVRQCAEDSRREGFQVISDTAYPGYMEIPAWVIEGYSTIFIEIEDQIGRAPDVVIVQAGVGGLAAAVVRHYRQDGRPDRPAIVCVQPVVADGLIESVTSEGGEARPAKGNLETIMSGLSCAMPSLVAWPILRSAATMFMSIEDRFAVEAVRRLYDPTGGDARVVAGEAGAAGLAGLLALMREPVFGEAKEKLRLTENACVLVINSEGDTDPVNFRKIIDGQSGL